MKKPSNTLIRIAIVVVLAAGAIGLASWSEAAGTWTPAPPSPPANNVDAPINVGTSDQIKLGSLNIGINSSNVADLTKSLATAGLKVLTDNFYYYPGTSVTPGHVLTALDENGRVGWQEAPAGSGSTVNGSSVTYVAITPAKLLDCDTTLRNCTDSVGNRWIAVDLSGRWIPVSYPSAVPVSARALAIRFEAHQNGVTGANGVITTTIKADNLPTQVVSNMQYTNQLSNNDDFNTVLVPYSNSRNIDIMMQINPSTDAQAYVVGYLTSNGTMSTEAPSWYILNASGDLVRKGNQTDPACDAAVGKDHPKCPDGMIMAGIDLCKPSADVTKVAIWCVPK